MPVADAYGKRTTARKTVRLVLLILGGNVGSRFEPILLRSSGCVARRSFTVRRASSTSRNRSGSADLNPELYRVILS